MRLSYAVNVFLNNSSYQLKLKETCQLGAELVNDASVQADTESIAMDSVSVSYTHLDELDIRFKTISDWIYFVSYKKGYKPYQLDEDEVALLTETYENLYMVLEAVKDGKLNPDIEQAEGIVRRYNSENDTWEMFRCV